jgi:hypothetical protein
MGAGIPSPNSLKGRTMKIGKARRQHPRRSEISDGKMDAIGRAYADAGKAREQVAAEFGVGQNTVTRAVEILEARRQGQIAASVNRQTLSMTAQQKLEAAIKQEKRGLQAEFHQTVQAELKRVIDETVLPQYLKEMAQARQVTESRKGLMHRETFRLILGCLHPDRVTDPELKERYTRAFHAFSDLELVLCNEKEMPTAPAAPMPRSYEEMMRMRAEATARRRKSSNSVQQKSI